MRLLTTFVFFQIITTQNSFAVVMRDDVPEKHYQVETAPEYLVDMLHEGHGVLISPRWIVTVAHLIFYNYQGKEITIRGKHYKISKVIIHPEYGIPDESILKGDAKPLMGFFKSRSDIALIKLTSAVDNVVPIQLYSNTDEKGKLITVYGRGAKGNGVVGELLATKSQKVLNKFQNIITQSQGNWLSFKFDHSPDALKLEGMHGSGDSGGPSIMYLDKSPVLLGLSSWQYWNGDISAFKGGLYGTTGYQVRISSYVEWINSVIMNNK